ncbi:MAG: class I SAM-dependent methyltransferase [Alphaproteobacteria bacterium CG_4_10_14_0_8_um_filter_37_21]|nr:MAG: class I SAM-dependent methyltransferase [Alphaproteobacteria bacterium CG_4_10_14_0_8_um_filter_37_21]
MTNEKITDTKERFAFGKNWANFLNTLNEERIAEAVKSFTEKTGLSDMTGLTVLDAGSGSGLFSLAAYKLGAKVLSFDYDTDSVACTKYLKEKYCTDDAMWQVQQGSVLDQDFLKQFGEVDVLYSWGELHHTGHMYEAFKNVSNMVKKDGTLFISIYNDQGSATRRWTWIKKKYTNSGSLMRSILTTYTLFRQWTITFVKDFLRCGNPLKTWCAYKENRGMSAWHDVVDWVGGYPFETAKPEQVFHFFKEKDFQLEYLKTCAGGLGCNEFIFKKK